MIEILTTEYPDTMGIRLSGELKASDYDKIIPVIEYKIDIHGKINLYCELGELKSIEVAAIWKDLKFDVRHFSDFRRVAIVGHKSWMDWATQFTKPFTSAKVRYFDTYDKHEAMAWAAAKGLKV